MTDDLTLVDRANKAAYQKRYASKQVSSWQPASGKVRQHIANGGACECCGATTSESRGFGLDHHHASGRERGVICRNCNIAIGWLRDDPAHAQAVAAYLTAHGS